MAREILTAADCIEAMNDVLGGVGTPIRAQRRAIQSAIREVCAESSSGYMHKRSRLHLEAPYSTGTITYDHTGGSSERLVTLSGGTWPTWAEDASILLDDMVCDVEQRLSDTTLTLDVAMNPGADLAAGTTYTLYKRYYVLPDDFDETAGFWGEDINRLGRQVSMDDLLALDKYDDASGDLEYYAIGGIADLVGHVGVFLHPYPSAEAKLDYVYQRKPREVRYVGYDAADYTGTITVSTSSTGVTGSGTAFDAKMVGSVIRIGGASYVPTGLNGEHPYVDERVITAVSGTDALTLDRAPSVSGSSLKYRVADMIDMDPVFRDAFMARCIYDVAVQRNNSAAGMYGQNYREALRLAKMASCRDCQPQVAMQGPVYFERKMTFPGELA